MLQRVLDAFGLKEDHCTVTVFGSGLINHTWKVTNSSSSYILQRINQKVFENPGAIAFNINTVAHYLHQHFPDYLFVMPVKSVYGEDIFFDRQHGYFRLSPFVGNSHTIDVVGDPKQAFEAACQFGRFTKLLAAFDVTGIKITLPDFHNLPLRYEQFERALSQGDPARLQQAAGLIDLIIGNKHLVDVFDKIKNNPRFKLRATHHDTKISNVLFDGKDDGLCVIDLDTLMPGYFISDVGDMIRTYVSPVSEEEGDFTRIDIRIDYFRAIVEGYLGQMQGDLSEDEKAHFVYAGKFMIYMQAVRFLADYLNNDVYYGSKYEGQNFVRAGNQLTLLRKLVGQESILQAIVSEFCENKVPSGC